MFPINWSSEQVLQGLKMVLNSRASEMLVAAGIIALVLHHLAMPLQRIPEKMDAILYRLGDLQVELANHCYPKNQPGNPAASQLVIRP